MTVTVRPYYHPTSDGMQLQHWEVVISTPQRDVIEIRATQKSALARAQQLSAGSAA